MFGLQVQLGQRVKLERVNIMQRLRDLKLDKSGENACVNCRSYSLGRCMLLGAFVNCIGEQSNTKGFISYEASLIDRNLLST